MPLRLTAVPPLVTIKLVRASAVTVAPIENSAANARTRSIGAEITLTAVGFGFSGGRLLLLRAARQSFAYFLRGLWVVVSDTSLSA